MPTISQICNKESVWIKYKDTSGKVINEIVQIDSSYHSNVKIGKPFRISCRPGLIGLIDMPGKDGGLWAVSSFEEYQNLSDAAERKRKEIAEAEAWRKIVEEEDNTYHRHDEMSKRRTKKASQNNMPYQRVIIYHNAFETNRRKH